MKATLIPVFTNGAVFVFCVVMTGHAARSANEIGAVAGAIGAAATFAAALMAYATWKVER